MTLISTTYSSDADIDRKMGAATRIGWADLNDDGVADEGVSDDWHNQAAQEIDGYARQRYDDSSMQQSNLINRWATVLACYYGSQTRGNPPPQSLADQAADIFSKLEMVAADKYQLPGVALRGDLRPTMSNVKIDRRFVQQKVRVQQTISTNAPSTVTQNQAIDVPTTYP